MKKYVLEGVSYMKELGFGIIGCGFISGCHALAIKDCENARLIGATDVFAPNAEKFTKEHGIRNFATVEELLACDEIDVVCICTPSGFHAPNALQAIRAGKHVIVEKPLALNTKDCDELIAEAKKQGVKAAVISQVRFSDGFARLKDLIESGRLGKVVMADLKMKYFRNEEYYSSSSWRGTWEHDGGGALMNQGIHGIDLMLGTMGDVKSVQGLARTLRHDIETEDTATAIFEFENGAIGCVCGTTSAYPGYPRLLTISGTKGSVALQDEDFVVWDIEGEEKPADFGQNKGPGGGASSNTDISYIGHYRQITNFIDAVLNDKEPTCSFEVGKKAVELITSIYEASQKDTTVKL